MNVKCARLILTVGLMVLSDLAAAESWDVSVTASYFSNKRELVAEVPVVHFVVPVGECVEGVSRVEDMNPKPMRVTQRVCVRSHDGVTEFSGWLFVTKRVTDEAFREARGQLNYGTPLRAVTDGSRVSFRAGMYEVSATRLMSLP